MEGRDGPREEKVKKGEWWYVNAGFLSSRREAAAGQAESVCKLQCREAEKRS